MVSNKKKAEQLGMPFGTAQNRLRKIVMFDLLRRHGENLCFRCGEEIKEVSQLSIEHKESWLDVDPALFWDMNNIAFSHSKCNYGNGRRMAKNPIPHGTHSGYAYRGCRCEKCKKAHSEYQRRYRT